MGDWRFRSGLWLFEGFAKLRSVGSKQTIIIGRCYCGKVRYRASGSPKFQGNCHCANCRRAAGAQAVAWISVAKASFKFTRGKPKRYRTPTKAWRTFCTSCGTSLTYETPKRPRDVDITTGSIDHPERFPPNRDFFVKEKISWVARVSRRHKPRRVITNVRRKNHA